MNLIFHRWEVIHLMSLRQHNINSSQKIHTALTLKSLNLKRRIKNKFNKLIKNRKNRLWLNKRRKNHNLRMYNISRVCNNQNKTHQNKRKMSFQQLRINLQLLKRRSQKRKLMMAFRFKKLDYRRKNVKRRYSRSIRINKRQIISNKD